MDTAGKAVLFSGVPGADLAQRGDARAQPRLPVDEPGDHARGHVRPGGDADAAPGGAGEARPARGQARASLAHSGEHRSARFAAVGERLWKRPLVYGAIALAVLIGLAIPVTQLNTAMPSIKVVPATDSSRVGYNQAQAGFGPGATGPMQIVAPAAQATQAALIATRDPGIAAVLPTQTSGGYALVTAVPKQDPSNPAVGSMIDRSAPPAECLPAQDCHFD